MGNLVRKLSKIKNILLNGEIIITEILFCQMWIGKIFLKKEEQ